IGSKEDDNPGLLLFIAFDDRKYFTHVSRDLEDELPDGVVGQIQRQYLVPAFRQGNYAKGIVDTIEAYIQKIQEKQSSTKVSEDKKSNPSQRDNFQVGRCEICFILIIILILFVLFGGIGKRKRRNNTGFFVFPVGSGSGWSSGGSDWDGGDWGGFGGGGDFGGGGAGGDW
ncbi:MAG: TPM domain-containing protein, partial [Pyrinomonadaceae bacterium]|nr:TPM domain-containing protein [Pyrinomonadaceae bacterium]